MKRFLLCGVLAITSFISFAQNEDTRSKEAGMPTVKPSASKPKAGIPGTNAGRTTSNDFIIEKIIPATPVKNQAQTGTCWSFSTTSLIESQSLKNKTGEFDLSEWFTVRNIYIEKAKNYILRQGHARFTEGGLGHDQIRAIALYGTMPEEVYTGLNGEDVHNHSTFVKDLQNYLDTVLKSRPINPKWLTGFTSIMDKMMGTPPQSFMYNNKKYTPQTFAKEVVKFNENDYVNITSFTHHPYYTSYVLEVPDNFSNGAYFNVPLSEMMDVIKSSIRNGYSVMWDADVSNSGFRAKQGFALHMGPEEAATAAFDITSKELTVDEKVRQSLFESLLTQDDHLMHIVGIDKSKEGKLFFNVKNSWGTVGPYGGYVKVSEAYMAMNTISLVVPRAALSKSLLDKIK